MIEIKKVKEELLQCPFCGNVPDIDDPDCIYPITRSKSVWSLSCFATGGGCNAEVLGDSAADVIKKWNRRVVK